jgi:hypothetical protein
VRPVILSSVSSFAVRNRIGEVYPEDQVGLFLQHGGDRLCPVADRSDGEPGEAQRGREEVADVRLVVDDQDLGAIGHAPII